MLIVDKEYDSEAHAKFDHLGVKVVRGHHILGEMLKQPISLLKTKSRTGQTLLLISLTLQNRTFVALSKSLQFEWSYLQRLIPNIGNAFTSVWNAINTSFWSVIFDSAISQQDQLLLLNFCIFYLFIIILCSLLLLLMIMTTYILVQYRHIIAILFIYSSTYKHN